MGVLLNHQPELSLTSSGSDIRLQTGVLAVALPVAEALLTTTLLTIGPIEISGLTITRNCTVSEGSVDRIGMTVPDQSMLLIVGL